MNTRSLLIVSTLLFASLLQAQQGTAVPSTPAPAPSPAVGKTSEPEVKIKDSSTALPLIKGEKDVAGHETISVDFPEEDIRTILRSVADLFELNLVIPETLQGKTSVKLRDVSWRQIFQVVLAPVGYSYVEEGNIIKIVSNESMQAEPVATEVFILNYARCSDILPTISSLVDTAAGGKIVVDARSNALVITERPSRIIRIRPILESLDRATDQVMIETKFIEVTDSDIKNLGVKWDSLSGMSVSAKAGGANDTFGTYNRTQNGGNSGSSSTQGTNSANNSGSTTTTGSTGSTSSSGTNSNVTSTNGVLTSVSGTTAATGLTGSAGTTTTDASTLASGTVLNSLQSLTSGSNTDRTLSAVFSASEFKVVLSALTQLSNTRIVSNPTIVTLNNTEAFINVGSEYPIPNYTYNQERGTYEVTGFNYRAIGIILKVTPQVNARGFIKLSVEPEVSQQNGTSTFGTASIPIIATRKAKTQVSLKDGYTMGIGGLIRKDSTDAVTKVPVLGDIPLLGNLFKHKNKNATTTNLLIFISARVVAADGGSIQQVFSPDQVKDMKLTQKDLPGYREETSPLLPNEAPPPDKKASKKATSATTSNNPTK
jgi:type IV pilus assembly protein PilQ